MEWRKWIEQAYADGSHEGRPDFREGVTGERLSLLESQLGMRLPTALRELLQGTDGVGQMMHLYDKWSRVHTEVWSCDKIADENRNIRIDADGPQPPPGAPDVAPLYFAYAGVDGILFAFFVGSSEPDDPAVYAYYPIEGEWRRVSRSLRDHLRGWTV